MGPKRKNDDTGELTAREKKKFKLEAARTIMVQSTTPVPMPENATAGPSTLASINGMKHLPSAIDVEKFAEARAFEINAMHTAMKTASASSTQRAWQALPRHLRRRAASHDVRRVPLRLRDRARTEMDPVRRKALGRSMPKRGEEKRISRTKSFLKRQRDKVWLETHIWHAKRMKMENMWGYRLAVHPTEKSFRPSHRASVHGSILHDASYYSLIELKGSEKILRSVLEVCCDPQGQGPGAKRYLTGARTLETHIYKPGSYPFDLIAPITVIWMPTSLLSESKIAKPSANSPPPHSSTLTDPIQPGGKKRKRKGRSKETTPNTSSEPQLDSDMSRIVWIRSHPVVYEEVFSALQTAASLALDAVRNVSDGTGTESVNVELADLRGQVNVFEIMGPKSNQVIKGAFTPVSEDKREEFVKFWSSLTDLQTSGSVPRGMVIGFKVNDPRLKFPPKNAKPRITEATHVLTGMTTFPTSTLARSEIWDESMRNGLKKPRYKKKDLDERRSKNLIPGTPLSPLRQDDRIPVLLIQHSLEPSTSFPGSGSDTQALHGWTLIIPSGWSMPFFSSLTFTGTRVGGQRERQTQAFEAGSSYFPRDYPATGAYNIYAKQREEEERARWEKKPPAKRANFEKLGTRSAWKADWEVVLGLEGLSDERLEVTGSAGEGGEFVTTQREDPMNMDQGTGDKEKKVRPWLLRGVDVNAILASSSKLFNQGAGLLDEINRLRTKRNQDRLDANIKGDELLKCALVSVRLMMCTRGAPDDLAVIYAVKDEEARMWNKVLQRRKAPGADLQGDETPDEIELSDIKPPQDTIIGYITSGNFSLSQGKGFTIGSVPVARLFELQQQAQRMHSTSATDASRPLPLLVKVRNRDGHKCRAAHLEVLEG